MSAPKEFTTVELTELLDEQDIDHDGRNLIQKWIARGDSVLVYENADLGHRDLGSKIFVSYGSTSAQIEQAQFPEPPRFLPDGIAKQYTGGINWRYTLIGGTPKLSWPWQEVASS